MLNMDRVIDRFVPTWLLAAIIAVNYVGVTVLVYLEFRAYADHSTRAIAHWAFLYFVALVQPAFFGLTIHRQLKDAGLSRRRLNFYALAPGIVGGVTLLFALNLIGG